MSEGVTRREFAAVSVGAAMALSTGTQASDAVRLGFIGVGNRGMQLLRAALSLPDVRVTALCDVFRPHLDAAAATVAANVPLHGDYRRMLESPDVDAVVIATPDHWHALQTIDACEAGKDVYVEKPLSLTVREGRAMVEAARQTNRVVQCGLQRRSSPAYQHLARYVRAGGVGKVTVARAYRLSNMHPLGIGRAPDGPPPPGLDWDMWLGPSPKRPYNPIIAPYKFRWWKAYSSQVANWGVHYFDAIRWALGEQAPSSVCALGGRYAVEDARDIPDTMEVTFEFASGRILVFGQYEASGAPAMVRGEIELRGTQGLISADESGYEVTPEQGGQYQSREPRMEPYSHRVPRGSLDAAHLANFVSCVRTRQRPACDVEDGHRSTVFAHLANISLATRARLDWDAASERFLGHPRANGLLHTAYRRPWRLR